MKKSTLLALFVALSLFLVACGNSGSSAPSQDATVISTAPDSVPVESVSEGSSAPAQTDDEYVVAINGFNLVKDYDGNPAIVIDFSFTNNSDEAISFMVATYAQAFQDGIELESAFVRPDDYNAENSMKDIKTGATLDVQQVFALDSDSSPVEIEVTPLFALDDTMLASATFEIA